MELKTPLRVDADGFGTETVVDAEGERLFVTDDGVDYAVAELVRRANAYEAMVAERDALRKAHEEIVNIANELMVSKGALTNAGAARRGVASHFRNISSAALAAAKGGA